MAAPGPVPVTLLTGFLGSGKTTLLNRLVDAPQAGRVAVIVNEAGEVALDGRLVVGSTEEIVELREGCICCTVRGDLREAVGRLLDRRGAWLRRLRFDRILVECSGLASPGPVVQTFLLDARLAEQTRVDGVIALASAPDLARALAEHPQSGEQLGYADQVLLNHADRVDAAGLAQAMALVRRANPAAAVQSTVRAEVAPGPLLDLGGHDPRRWRLERAATEGDHDAHDAHHDHDVHDAHDVTHLAFETGAEVDLGRLKLFLQFVAARRTWSLIRLKGLFRCQDQARAVVAHGIYQWLELGPADLPRPDRSQLVLIGRGLDAAELGRAWTAAVGPPG